jgi:hypothetical protein
MNKPVVTEPRNLGVSVLAGTITIVAALIASMLMPIHWTDLTQDAYFIGACVIALLGLVAALYGRVSVFKAFIESIFSL